MGEFKGGFTIHFVHYILIISSSQERTKYKRKRGRGEKGVDVDLKGPENCKYKKE